ncbi:MAG: DUF1837 domain-containing protein [Nitrospira sp.]
MNDPGELNLSGRYEGIDARIKIAKKNWKSEKLKLSGDFYYLSFCDSVPTIEEFVKFLYWRTVPFCLPRSERADLEKQFQITKDYRYLHELLDRARDLFIRAKAAQATTGEPGELILYVLLEAFLGAPQIACKMYLKTNANVPVHGADSIHIRYDNSSETLRLYWGESKLYGDLGESLSEALSSIKAFTTPVNGLAPRERDVHILKDHTNVDDPKIRAAILNYFDPYCEESNKRVEVFACLSAFDYPFLSKCGDLSKDTVEKEFLVQYEKRIKTACALFEKKVKEAGLSNLSFYLFLLPFKSVNELRDLFFQKMGIS